MNVLGVISPGLKAIFERLGKPEVINRPDLIRFGGTGAVIACNHVGWAQPMDGLCRVPQTTALYVKRGTVRLNAIALGLDAWRFRSD